MLARPGYSKLVNHYLIALLAILPPIAVAVATNQVGFLVGITGSYAGAGIQYVIPTCLVLMARRKVTELEQRLGSRQLHRSWFSHKWWILLVLVWSVMCVSFVTVNHIITKK